MIKTKCKRCKLLLQIEKTSNNVMKEQDKQIKHYKKYYNILDLGQKNLIKSYKNYIEFLKECQKNDRFIIIVLFFTIVAILIIFLIPLIF